MDIMKMMSVVYNLAKTNEGKEVFKAYSAYASAPGPETVRMFVDALKNLDALGSALGMSRFMISGTDINEEIKESLDFFKLMDT